MRRFNLALAVLAILTLVLGSRAIAQNEVQTSEGWSALEQLRAAMQTSPLSASFVQTYLPAGFAEGEKETGQMFAALPNCLRWDYELPFPKIFLLCDNTAFSWNPGEGTGRRLEIESDSEPGLDLMRLDLATLRERYEVEALGTEDGELQVVLHPLLENFHLVQATLSLANQGERLGAVSFRDREGNLTTFNFTDYQALDDPGLFSPPENLEWMDDH